MKSDFFDNKRRKFMIDSARIAGAAAFINAIPLSAAGSPQGNAMNFVTLNNGVKMPILGFGTYNLRGARGQSAILSAINVGYRLIDTAQMYGNEIEVGNAVATAINYGVLREDFFITTKLSSNMTYDEVMKRFDDSMRKLQLEYLDLLLIHSNYRNAKEMYRAMEDRKSVV